MFGLQRRQLIVEPALMTHLEPAVLGSQMLIVVGQWPCLALLSIVHQ
jgi:hypothetical protein